MGLYSHNPHAGKFPHSYPEPTSEKGRCQSELCQPVGTMSGRTSQFPSLMSGAEAWPIPGIVCQTIPGYMCQPSQADIMAQGQRPRTQAHRQASIPLSMAEFWARSVWTPRVKTVNPSPHPALVSDVTDHPKSCIPDLAKTNPSALGNSADSILTGPAAKTQGHVTQVPCPREPRGKGWLFSLNICTTRSDQ